MQVQTALHSFDILQKPQDTLKVNCNCPEYDQQLFGRIFVSDEVEALLGVDLAELNVPPPTTPAPAKQDAPEPAPPEHKQASDQPCTSTVSTTAACFGSLRCVSAPKGSDT